MARYQLGDSVAVINKFSRCGKIVAIDKKGYKVDSGKDVVFYYEKDIVLISDINTPNINEVMTKIDNTVGEESWFTDDFSKSIKDYIENNSGVARAFCDYVAKVPENVLASCLKAIKDSRLKLPESISINLNININLIKLG
jgi:hypothetical protein